MIYMFFGTMQDAENDAIAERKVSWITEFEMHNIDKYSFKGCVFDFVLLYFVGFSLCH